MEKVLTEEQKALIERKLGVGKNAPLYITFEGKEYDMIPGEKIVTKSNENGIFVTRSIECGTKKKKKKKVPFNLVMAETKQK